MPRKTRPRLRLRPNKKSMPAKPQLAGIDFLFGRRRRRGRVLRGIRRGRRRCRGRVRLLVLVQFLIDTLFEQLAEIQGRCHPSERHQGNGQNHPFEFHQLASHGDDVLADWGTGKAATLAVVNPDSAAKLRACAGVACQVFNLASSSPMNLACFSSSSFRPRRPATATTRLGSDRVVAAPTTSPSPAPPRPPAPARTDSSRNQPVDLPEVTRNQPPCLESMLTLAPLGTLAATLDDALGWL